ncbi:hypothetical protein LSTR_LSTR013332 [Laodelphax striatellus]|uniref:Uncharacterized protein n=1 Tax=Laodelphax striatellus TaxID=195883 RepID=A0A482XJK7_LAOST|nr:hypothetical protein LSTR_LSTR013332 [Laodelphax striatellus]
MKLVTCIINLSTELLFLCCLQERTFCLGPASVAQLLVDLALTGVVAQTHVSSLVTVAYLANLLATNEKVDGLIVFGAGSRKELCEEYLQALGVTNTTVHAASFSELSAADSDAILANVVTVLATPPNTNSHVRDAVDLAVARGGDLLLLHQLTQETFHASSQGHTQVMHTMLAEQRDTLRMSMSKPQIQFVVYETHSRYDLENSEMVVRVITEMNGYATEKHLEEQRKRRFGGAQQEGVSTSVDLGQPPNKMATTDEEAPLMAPPLEEITINVPACDLFELSPLPDLCPHRDECLKLEEEGTYIAVIKRKEITRLDPKYMIEMAESRGLFGSKGGGEGGEGGGGARRREQRRKAAAAQRLQRTRSNSADANNRSKVKVELERIAAPTHASMVRDVRLGAGAGAASLECPRHQLHLSGAHGRARSETRARLWWTQLAELVLDLIRDRVDLAADPPPADLPRLRLKRSRLRPVRKTNTVHTPRTPLPMHVNYIEFQSDDDNGSSSDCDDDDDILQLCPCLASVLTASTAPFATVS